MDQPRTDLGRGGAARQTSPLVPLLWFLAAGLLLAGLVLGDGRTLYDGDWKCGSAFREDSDLAAKEFAETMVGGSMEKSSCDAVRAQARTTPIILLIMGATAGGAAVYVRATNPGSPGLEGQRA